MLVFQARMGIEAKEIKEETPLNIKAMLNALENVNNILKEIKKSDTLTPMDMNKALKAMEQKNMTVGDLKGLLKLMGEIEKIDPKTVEKLGELIKTIEKTTFGKKINETTTFGKKIEKNEFLQEK